MTILQVDDQWHVDTDHYQLVHVVVATMPWGNGMRVRVRSSHRGDDRTKARSHEMLMHYGRYFNALQLCLAPPQPPPYARRVFAGNPYPIDDWPSTRPGEPFYDIYLTLGAPDAPFQRSPFLLPCA
jgi:hypothetical protein